MMKVLSIFAFSFIVLGLGQFSSHAQSSLLNHEKFVHLTLSQKKEIVKKTMELIVSIEEQYRHEVKKNGPNSKEAKKFTLLLKGVRNFFMSPAYAQASRREWSTHLTNLSSILNKSNSCLYAGWVSQIRGRYCVHPSTLPRTASEFRSYQAESSCTGINQISCNPVIFGFKSQRTKSLFCVPAGDVNNQAHNAALSCMNKALAESSQEGDSKEDRLTAMALMLEQNKDVAKQVYEFVAKACLCENSSPQLNQRYHNYMRPHQTCYGMMNMLAEVADKCETSPIMEESHLNILSSLRTKIISDTPSGDNYGSFYTSFLDDVKTSMGREIQGICPEDPMARGPRLGMNGPGNNGDENSQPGSDNDSNDDNSGDQNPPRVGNGPNGQNNDQEQPLSPGNGLNPSGPGTNGEPNVGGPNRPGITVGPSEVLEPLPSRQITPLNIAPIRLNQPDNLVEVLDAPRTNEITDLNVTVPSIVTPNDDGQSDEETDFNLVVDVSGTDALNRKVSAKVDGKDSAPEGHKLVWYRKGAKAQGLAAPTGSKPDRARTEAAAAALPSTDSEEDLPVDSSTEEEEVLNEIAPRATLQPLTTVIPQITPVTPPRPNITVGPGIDTAMPVAPPVPRVIGPRPSPPPASADSGADVEMDGSEILSTAPEPTATTPVRELRTFSVNTEGGHDGPFLQDVWDWKADRGTKDYEVCAAIVTLETNKVKKEACKKIVHKEPVNTGAGNGNMNMGPRMPPRGQSNSALHGIR